MLRIVSWNINGIRAALKKGMWDKINQIKPDILGVQEIKADDDFMKSFSHGHDEFSMNYFSARNRKGYSGVATFLNSGSFDINQIIQSNDSSNEMLFEDSQLDKTVNNDRPENAISSSITVEYGIQDEEFDVEGRMITHVLPLKNSRSSLIIMNGYYPQGGRGPERIEYKIRFYKKVYEKAREYVNNGFSVILLGDFNTTVGDIDLARPKENRNTTGCLPEEREALNWFLEGGFVDTFRHFYPDQTDIYTYWDQITRARERNVGWRIDYVIVSQNLIPLVKNAYIWDHIMGSDHCPVGIDIDI